MVCESNPDRKNTRIVILGGGLAGMSAALSLLEKGFDVTLVERRPFLGGRVFSFQDPETGLEVDNGQHVFLGCCSYYIRYLKLIGSYVNTHIQEGMNIEVVSESKKGALRSRPFWGRLHLLPAFIRYPHLSFTEKLLAAYCLLKIRFTNRSKQLSLDNESAYDWFRKNMQSERIIKNLWNVIILPALNDGVRNVSADMALMVLQDGILGTPAASSVGYSKVGLTTLNGDPAGALIEANGGKMRLGVGVRNFNMCNDLVKSVVLSDGTTIQADTYISALPHRVLSKLISVVPNMEEIVSNLETLEESPIIGIHLWYDRQIMDEDFLAFIDSPIQFVFNKNSNQDTTGSSNQYICISLSGAWEYIDVPKDDLIERFTREMTRLFPRAMEAVVVRALVVKERSATIRCIPGHYKLRPGQVTPVPNLFLAGDWTDTGWPATMEGAVRSGILAADQVISIT